MSPPAGATGPCGDEPPSPLVVPVYYDFASSIAYVAHRVMQRMEDELVDLGIALLWRPIDLASLLGWRRGEAPEPARRQNALRVARELGVDLRMPAVWVDSRPAMAIALRLGPSDLEHAWRERVWSAIFEEGRDVGAAGEMERLAADLGLASAADSGSSDPELDLAEVTRAAVEAGVSGVPTFVLGGWPFGGIQEEATMRSILGRFAEKTRGDRSAAIP